MRRWRDLAVVAVGAAVVVAILLAGGGSKAERVAPTTTTSTTVPVTTTTALLPSLQLGSPSGVRLLVTSERGVVLVELDTGLRTLVSPSRRSSYAALAHGVVAQDGKGIEYLSDSLEQPGVLFGTADVVVPSPRVDRMWLVGYGSANATVREVDTTGAVTAGPFAIPSAGVINATDDALVTSIDGAVELFDRQGHSRNLGNGEVVTAGADSVVVSDCDVTPCALSVIDVHTGARTSIPDFEAPDHVPNPSGRVSPDGRAAAVYEKAGDSVQVRLVDLASGRTLATGLPLGSGGPALLAWSRDSKWVFAANGQAIHALRVDGDTRLIDLADLAPANSLAAL